MTTISQDSINNAAWSACDSLRGALDGAFYKDYVLALLFLKYMSDLWLEKKAAHEERYDGDAARVARALARERFTIPDGCDFYCLHAQRELPEVKLPRHLTHDEEKPYSLGERLNIAFAKLEEANPKKLEGVFSTIDFNSEVLGDTKDRHRRLANLLGDFNKPELDLRPSRLGGQDIIGNTYEYLIERFAGDAGKKGGEFYTPRPVAQLMARLIAARPGSTICDPACGSGSLLIRVAEEIKRTAATDQERRDFALCGQESNYGTWSLARMNMFLHDMDAARIERGDTLNSPKLLDGGALMHFDIVVANPPFSLDKWGAEHAAADPFKRFWRGVPPKSKGDYAFISHMVEAMKPETGRMAVVVPHGVLFRGGAEGAIRRQLVEENLLKAVIGLPANLFFGTGIPAAILIFDRAKAQHVGTDVLFIDASREFASIRTQNILTDEHITHIVETFGAFADVEKYAHRATQEEIRGNDFNLNIPRYVDTFEEEEEIDIAEVQKEIDRMEVDLAEVRTKMNEHLAQLGLVPAKEK
jgi:type I restriction enzyme M protein